jgi:hypothetical protein
VGLTLKGAPRTGQWQQGRGSWADFQDVKAKWPGCSVGGRKSSNGGIQEGYSAERPWGAGEEGGEAGERDSQGAFGQEGDGGLSFSKHSGNA